MKLVDIKQLDETQDVPEGSELVHPTITWRENGDKSWLVRIDYKQPGEVVQVHSNKNKATLEKLVKERYGPRVFKKQK